MSEWTVYVRDASLARTAQVDDYQRLALVENFNDTSTWLLELSADAGGADAIQADGAGIVVVRDGVVELSGPVTHRERNWASNADRLTISGLDDTVWLSRRLAHPQPATAAPPYNSSAYDSRTGQCSAILGQFVNVNAGPGALGARQVPGLTLAADPALGTTVTGQGRWQALLELLQELALAGGGLGFRVQQSGAGIQFSVYQPADRTASVIFSADLGNLRAFASTEEAPTGNYVFVGGGGEGTARTVQEGQDSASIARWGRVETFVDRRDTTDAAQLSQAATDSLQQAAGPMDLSITPIDLPQMTYGTHYGLGDKVSVVKGDAVVQDVIRQVQLSLTPEGGALIVPVIATPGQPVLLGIFDALRDARSRLTNLERR